MPSSPVCVDANIAVMIVAPETMRPLALALWQSWLSEQREIVAPRLFDYEITSALLRKYLRDILTLEEARSAVQTVLDMQVTLLDPPDLPEQAFDLAVRLRRPAAYDAHYLALAQQLQCPFWTADERLYNAVHAEFPLIRWLGNYRPGI